MDRSISILLDRLRRISPMPEDDLLPAPLIITYQEIVSELAQYRHPDTIRPLIDSFGYGEADGAYWSTLHLLESFPWELVEPELKSAILTGLAGPSQWAAHMLGRKKSQAAVPSLVGLLKHDKPLVRASAVLALASIGDPAALEAVRGLLDDPSVEVRNEVRRAIDTLRE
ncbi:MAG TPA: HEAT repeat domain-containing protein [Symbiobacteriaceae bacterium]|nr:HEAT repeat domain-containing protein [Symbiobacteriaceae bacterium]